METSEKQGTRVSGVVEKYLANKHGDIDALELKTDKEHVKINFPPHTAKTIMHKAGQGSHVTVTYQADEPKHEGKDDKKPKLKLVSVTDAQGSDTEANDIKPQKSAADASAETIKLDNYELLKDKKGELIGIKSGNKLFHIHKEDQQLGDKIKNGAVLEITAVKRGDEGFVNQHHDEVYHIQKVMVDGQEYQSQHKAKQK